MTSLSDAITNGAQIALGFRKQRMQEEAMRLDEDYRRTVQRDRNRQFDQTLKLDRDKFEEHKYEYDTTLAEDRYQFDENNKNDKRRIAVAEGQLSLNRNEDQRAQEVHEQTQIDNAALAQVAMWEAAIANGDLDLSGMATVQFQNDATVDDFSQRVTGDKTSMRASSDGKTKPIGVADKDGNVVPVYQLPNGQVAPMTEDRSPGATGKVARMPGGLVAGDSLYTISRSPKATVELAKVLMLRGLIKDADYQRIKKDPNKYSDEVTQTAAGAAAGAVDKRQQQQQQQQGLALPSSEQIMAGGATNAPIRPLSREALEADPELAGLATRYAQNATVANDSRLGRQVQEENRQIEQAILAKGYTLGSTPLAELTSDNRPLAYRAGQATAATGEFLADAAGDAATAFVTPFKWAGSGLAGTARDFAAGVTGGAVPTAGGAAAPAGGAQQNAQQNEQQLQQNEQQSQQNEQQQGLAGGLRSRADIIREHYRMKQLGLDPGAVDSAATTGQANPALGAKLVEFGMDASGAQSGKARSQARQRIIDMYFEKGDSKDYRAAQERDMAPMLVDLLDDMTQGALSAETESGHAWAASLQQIVKRSTHKDDYAQTLRENPHLMAGLAFADINPRVVGKENFETIVDYLSNLQNTAALSAKDFAALAQQALKQLRAQ